MYDILIYVFAAVGALVVGVLFVGWACGAYLRWDDRRAAAATRLRILDWEKMVPVGGGGTAVVPAAPKEVHVTLQPLVCTDCGDEISHGRYFQCGSCRGKRSGGGGKGLDGRGGV